jgi:hypothetical protein
MRLERIIPPEVACVFAIWYLLWCWDFYAAVCAGTLGFCGL